MDYAILFFVLLCSLGALIEAAFHRKFNEKVKNWLITIFVKFDDLTYIQLLNDDFAKARGMLDKVFGKKIFSFRLLFISICSALSIYFFIESSHPMYKNFNLVSYTFIIPFILFSILIDQLSLNLTRKILALCSGGFGRIFLLAIIDILIIVLLIAIPWTLAGLINDVMLDKFSLSTALVALPVLYIKMTNFALLPFWLPFVKHTLSWHLVLMTIIFVSPILPSVFHLLIIIRDITAKLMIIPILKLITGLLETMELSERPVLYVLGGLGAIPVIIQALKPFI